jgi:hypothetical protein
MTKEELKQEAEKSLDKRLGTYAYIRKQDCYTNYVDGYIDSAEPREKRIAELETRCNELFLQTMQLTNAKELLNEFMRISKASDEDFERDYSGLIEQAEQFLSEVEK